MNVVVTNSVALNGGDAAILYAIVRLLRKAFGEDTSITVCDAYGELAQGRHPDLDIRQQLGYARRSAPWFARRGPAKWARARYVAANVKRLAAGRPALLSASDRAIFDAFARADLVVSTGGTYLTNAYDLSPRLLDMELAHWLGKPLVLYTQSVEFIEDPRTRARVRDALSQAHRILLRDRRSLDNVSRMGVVDRCSVHADAVFALASDADLDRAIRKKTPRRGMRVAVSVRDWRHFRRVDARLGMRRYEDAIAGAVEWLVRERDASVEFVSSCQGAPEYAQDDSRTAARIVRRLHPSVRRRTRLDRKFHGPFELLTMLEGYDFAITTRMHMGILALCGGTPVVPIAYEFKTKELFSELGWGELPLDIEDLTAALVVERLDELLSTVDARRADLFGAIRRMRLDAEASMSRVAEALRDAAS